MGAKTLAHPRLNHTNAIFSLRLFSIRADYQIVIPAERTSPLRKQGQESNASKPNSSTTTLTIPSPHPIIPSNFHCHSERPSPCHSERPSPCHSERPFPCHSERPFPCHSERPFPCHSEQREESKIPIRQTHKPQQPPLRSVSPSDRETPHTNPKHNPILNS